MAARRRDRSAAGRCADRHGRIVADVVILVAGDDPARCQLPSSNIGFGTIEEAVARGKACLASGATIPCNFPPHLPASLNHALVQ